LGQRFLRTVLAGKTDSAHNSKKLRSIVLFSSLLSLLIHLTLLKHRGSTHIRSFQPLKPTTSRNTQPNYITMTNFSFSTPPKKVPHIAKYPRRCVVYLSRKPSSPTETATSFWSAEVSKRCRFNSISEFDSTDFFLRHPRDLTDEESSTTDMHDSPLMHDSLLSPPSVRKVSFDECDHLAPPRLPRRIAMRPRKLSAAHGLYLSTILDAEADFEHRDNLPSLCTTPTICSSQRDGPPTLRRKPMESRFLSAAGPVPCHILLPDDL
jgi:hypothetical protein